MTGKDLYNVPEFDHGDKTVNISDAQVAIEFVVAAVAGVAALLLASALGK